MGGGLPGDAQYHGSHILHVWVDQGRDLPEEDVCEQRKDVKPEHKLVSIRELASPPEFTEEKAREVSPAFEVLYTLIQAAMSYRQKDLATRKADRVKQKD